MLLPKSKFNFDTQVFLKAHILYLYFVKNLPLQLSITILLFCDESGENSLVENYLLTCDYTHNGKVLKHPFPFSPFQAEFRPQHIGPECPQNPSDWLAHCSRAESCTERHLYRQKNIFSFIISVFFMDWNVMSYVYIHHGFSKWPFLI